MNECQLNILINGYPANTSADSQCVLDHAPQGTSRQAYMDLRHALSLSGVCPFEGQDGVPDAENDQLIMDLAKTLARLRTDNKSFKDYYNSL